MTDSDLWRDSFLGSGQEGLAKYEVLQPERRGAKVYQRLTLTDLLAELQDDIDGLSAFEKFEALPEVETGDLILYLTKKFLAWLEFRSGAKGDKLCAAAGTKSSGLLFEHGGLGAPELIRMVYMIQNGRQIPGLRCMYGTAKDDLAVLFSGRQCIGCKQTN